MNHFQHQLLLLALAVTCSCLLPTGSHAATRVALTTTVEASADPVEHEMVASFLTLLELDLAQRARVQVVERMQLDLA